MKRSGLVFDTYAWVEYIAGGKYADKISELLASPSFSPKVTPATVLAELTERLLRNGDSHSKIERDIRFITSKTMVVQCDEKIAYRAGEINFTQKKKINGWGMLDSLNYAVASVMQCQFVTGDPHFKDFPDVIWIA